MSAADGISIIAPISIFSSNGIFSARNSALHFSTSALAWFNSSRPEIIGYIILTLPSALARRMARSWAQKQFRLREAEPDGAPAEKRIHLLRELQVRGEFVAAQIERADDDRMRFQRGGDLPVNFVLLFLARQAVAVDEQKFRAEQADAFRAVGDDGFDVVLVFDVRGEMDDFSVERDGGLLLDFAQFFLERRLDARKLAVFKQRLVGRIDDDRAVVAVEQRVIAGLEFLADVFNPTTAGMPSDRAMMAVCEVLPPMSVAKPRTNFLSSCAVVDGLKSWLTRMHGSVMMAQVELAPSPRAGCPARARSGRACRRRVRGDIRRPRPPARRRNARPPRERRIRR